MNARAQFFGRNHEETMVVDEQQIESCPICEGWGHLEREEECPYCDNGMITGNNHGWVILAATLGGDLPMAED